MVEKTVTTSRFAHWFCEILGHDWYEGNYMRRCERCNKHQPLVLDRLTGRTHYYGEN